MSTANASSLPLHRRASFSVSRPMWAVLAVVTPLQYRGSGSFSFGSELNEREAGRLEGLLSFLPAFGYYVLAATISAAPDTGLKTSAAAIALILLAVLSLANFNHLTVGYPAGDAR